jgi:hypothetical protein
MRVVINRPPIYPMKVGFFVDPRAARDRPTRKKITDLVDVILQKNQNSIVIADMVKDRGDRVLNWQGVKGRNALDDKDIYLIATFLNADKYANTRNSPQLVSG